MRSSPRSSVGRARRTATGRTPCPDFMIVDAPVSDPVMRIRPSLHRLDALKFPLCLFVCLSLTIIRL